MQFFTTAAATSALILSLLSATATASFSTKNSNRKEFALIIDNANLLGLDSEQYISGVLVAIKAYRTYDRVLVDKCIDSFMSNTDLKTCVEAASKDKVTNNWSDSQYEDAAIKCFDKYCGSN